MKKALLFLVLSIGFAFAGLAQQAEVKGKVLDGEDREYPLAFAEVKIKGTALQATTDLEGAFSLELFPGTYTFVVHFIGYKPHEIKDLVLTEKGLLLDPVVLKARKMGAGPIVASSESEE